MAPARGFAQKAAQELGLTTLVHSPRDIHLLLLTRLIRMFAYGSSTLILALFFAALNHSDAQIGLFMSLTLVGDVLISLLLTLVADSLGRRRILIMGALLMTFSGAVFATVGNYWILLLAAVLGVISPSGNEIGPFRAVEESTIAHLSDASTRSDVFAWYVVFGTLGTAGGALACGWVTQGLQAAGWSELASFRFVFWVYAGIGLVKAGLSLFLSPACEAQQAAAKKPEEREGEGVDLQEQQPFLADGSAAPPPKPKPVPKRIGITTLSAKSRATLIRLCALFFFDSLASGMVPNSLIAFFMERKFNMPQGKLGTILATASFMSSIGNIMASSIAKRIGLVKTMVFTHLPSAIFLALFPLPTSLVITIILLVARASLSSMDQAPRSAFLSAVVLPEERTAVMGIVNTVKTMSQSSGPLITGSLAGGGRFWVAFVVAGALKASYDVGMLTMFVGMKIEGDRKPEPTEEEAEHESDDDSLTGDAPANRSRS
ncbi:hypothetical protein LTR91_014900 [Friedmanniomyces endolithicus]|uniref:Major facilitator superfamily (MFS) profile domain-containing protein n=1 Tax=Friedmanniomyces endolithicus TaxID=329885 RepID=A0A4U0UYL2_9PEZI|nr:hypothetical protein LTS09_013480 [Friedmanniomyces endolithicus]KAK0268561.1 hypothetical protein LTR35_015448 [Friedmanniomyces endolithicus]KAK0286535.1 hypothetical protein LTS00_010473 [Friedmanniomyces endolithicus]KAK0303476.1 hypothetical protein LTR01_008031 [Friedmanniomyces endolithicus]KAK0317167.1 hypothetical protein LTR82_011768 [Friedmanniomyces endolithicus]